MSDFKAKMYQIQSAGVPLQTPQLDLSGLLVRGGAGKEEGTDFFLRIYAHACAIKHWKMTKLNRQASVTILMMMMMMITVCLKVSWLLEWLSYFCRIQQFDTIASLPMTAKQRVLKIQGDQPKDGTSGYGGENVKQRMVLRRVWKTLWEVIEMSTSGPGSEHDDGEELHDDDAPDW